MYLAPLSPQASRSRSMYACLRTMPSTNRPLGGPPAAIEHRSGLASAGRPGRERRVLASHRLHRLSKLTNVQWTFFNSYANRHGGLCVTHHELTAVMKPR